MIQINYINSYALYFSHTIVMIQINYINSYALCFSTVNLNIGITYQLTFVNHTLINHLEYVPKYVDQHAIN